MKHKKFFLAFLTALIIIAAIFLNMTYINTTKTKMRKEVLKSAKFSDAQKGYTIVFFSDLHYGTSIKSKQLDDLIRRINLVDADLVLFGGDLFDDYEKMSAEDVEYLKNALNKIEAKSGKFAVLGNHDLKNENVQSAIGSVLMQSEFEIITNTNLTVDGLNLVGIDSLKGGQADIEKAYEGVDFKKYTIALCHTPDILDSVKEGTDLLLSGHSHGGQINLPLISDYLTPEGAKNYIHGKYQKGTTLLDITNGVGTTILPFRLFADSEFVVYKLS